MTAPDVLEDDLRDQDWSALDHCGARTLLETRGWRFVAAGDWAVVLADPTGRLAARVCAFEPAFALWVDVCRRLAGNPWVPAVELAADLDGGGHLTVMELLTPRAPVPGQDPDDVDPLWWDPPDADLAALRAELERVDERCRGSQASWGPSRGPWWGPWWGGLDLKPDHFMVAADGHLRLVDPLFVAGEQLYAAVERDYPAFCAAVPPERRRHLLQIACFGRPELADGLRRLRAAVRGPAYPNGTADAEDWTRSVPSVAAVAHLVRTEYDLPVTAAVLVRSFVNDAYRVDTAERSYALKVYGVGHRDLDEVRWEQELVDHLVRSGVAVAAAVRRRDGSPAGLLRAPEGLRPYALTAWLPGAKPQPPWTDGLYRSVGAALARLHRACDGFTSDLTRRPFGTGREWVEVVAALAEGDPRRELVGRAAAAAGEHLTALAGRGLRRGVVHGDPSLDNLHVDAGEISFYDFDLAGPGYPVADLAGALATDFAEVFLAAYTAVRPLDAVELEALPWLRLRGVIENLRFHLVGKPRLQGTHTLSEGWVDAAFDALATTAADLGLL